MTRKIQLTKVHDQYHREIWTASFFVDGKPDPEIVDLFDTNEIPTPFLGNMPAGEVEDAIRELNPGYVVEVFAPVAERM